MTDTRAEDALRQQSTMESQRAVLDGHCQEVAERVLPSYRNFTTKNLTPGAKNSEKVFDSTAPLALERFSAAVGGMLTPRSSMWHGLGMADEEYQTDDIKRLLEQKAKMMFRYRYRAAANFDGEINGTWTGMGAFGNSAVFVDDDLGRGPIYSSIPFSETFWAENFQGRPDTVHRKFELTARQMAQKFGEDELPETIRKCLKDEPHRKFELVHCIRPREDASWSRMDYKGMKFASYYVSFEGRKILREGGYRTMRYAVGRYAKSPGEVYGRGPAMTVLAAIKTLNEQKKTALRTGQLSAEPPLLVTDDGGINPKLQPRAIIRGGLDQDGRATVQPLEVGANFQITLEMMQEEREVINDAFLVTLFRVLLERPTQITATEAMLLAQEKGLLLAPTGGRLQSEILEPIIEAEIDILAQMGEFADLPDELFEEGALKIEHTSPMARAMKAEEGIGIMRTLESLGPLGEMDPGAMNLIRGRGAKIGRRLGEINGMPMDLMNTDEEITALNEEDAQRSQTADLLGAAESASGSAANFAKAQSLIGAAPGQAPQVIPA